MAWIVKNITNGFVTLNDVKISFAPGEQMDLDNNVNMLSVGGQSDNLASLINKGILEVVQDDRVMPGAFSMPGIDHIRSVFQEAMSNDGSSDLKDEIQEIISRAMGKISNEIVELKSSQDDRLKTVEAIAKEVNKMKAEIGSKAELNQEIIGLITDLKESISRGLVVTQESIKSGTSGLNVDEITAQIHSARNQNDIGGKIGVEETNTDQSVDDVAALLRKTRTKTKKG